MTPTKYIEPSVERCYPNFNDMPHARPILTDEGVGRALIILASILLGLTVLALVLSLL